MRNIAVILLIVLFVVVVGIVRVAKDEPPRPRLPEIQEAPVQTPTGLSLIVDNRPAVTVEQHPFHDPFVIVIKPIPAAPADTKWQKMTSNRGFFFHPRGRWKLGLDSQQQLVTLSLPIYLDGENDEWLLDIPAYPLTADQIYVFEMLGVKGKPRQTEDSFFFYRHGGEMFRAPMLDGGVVY